MAAVLALGLITVVGLSLAGGVAVASTTTTTAPVDYASALTSRLAKEYGDAAIARTVVAGLDAGVLARLEARVPLSDVRDFAVPRVPTEAGACTCRRQRGRVRVR